MTKIEQTELIDEIIDGLDTDPRLVDLETAFEAVLAQHVAPAELADVRARFAEVSRGLQTRCVEIAVHAAAENADTSAV